MQPYTKKAIQTTLGAGVGFGAASVGIDYYNGDNIEFGKLGIKIFIFMFLMSIYFYYTYKKQSK